MLEESGRVEVSCASTDPEEALRLLGQSPPDVLFLDIQMAGMSGFELLEKVGEPQPLVVFTTAYDHYALEAFQVNSIDYLLKPIEPRELERALAKLDRTLNGSGARGDVGNLLAQVRAMLSLNASRNISHMWLRELEDELISSMSPMWDGFMRRTS
jgi:two-component system LytT family response regulator